MGNFSGIMKTSLLTMSSMSLPSQVGKNNSFNRLYASHSFPWFRLKQKVAYFLDHPDASEVILFKENTALTSHNSTRSCLLVLLGKMDLDRRQ